MSTPPNDRHSTAILERSARSLVTALREARATIARVEALHYPQNNGVEWLCYACGSPWPCPTFAALAPKETPDAD